MKDVNGILKQKIYDLIKPAVNCPVYYAYVPADVTGRVYVTVNTITNTDVSTMQSSDTDTAVLISIFSRETQGNAGKLVDDIAAAIYAVIYPNQQHKIDLSPGFQNIAIALVNDNTTDALATQKFIFINRFLTFRFNIYHR